MFEHIPLSYYRYGEYPRTLMPVGWHRLRSKWAIDSEGEPECECAVPVDSDQGKCMVYGHLINYSERK